MKRSADIELSQHADWDSWRDLKVPLDEAATDEFLIHVERQLQLGLTGFESMEFEPGRPSLVVVLNRPREDASALATEVDACIAAATKPRG